MLELRLVRPDACHRAAFLRCAHDHVDNSHDPERLGEYARAIADFDAYLAELDHFASHDEPRPGLVRQISLWLIGDGTAILGHLRLRPRLNARLHMIGGNIGYDVPPAQRGRGYATRMLSLGLREAAREGLERALLTADAANKPSMVVIERNGGVLDAEYEFEGVRRRRYRIEIASGA